MRCQKLRSLLPAYCKCELDSSVTSDIERHFHECDSCREELAAHRLIATTLTILADSSPNENHTEIQENSTALFEQSGFSDSDNASKPTFTPLQVSNDFNNRLMRRIANERFAETRTQAHKQSNQAFLPKNAPHFAFGKLIPAVVSVAAIAVFALVGQRQGMFDNQNSDNSNLATQNASTETPTNLAFTPDPILSAPALGEHLGLSEEYMTAQPINNPVYSSTATNATQGPSSPSTANGASLVSAQGNLPAYSSRRWRFASDYARTRRILAISNSMCRSGGYFQIVRFDANGVLLGPVGRIVFHCGPSSGRNNVVGSPQIIVQPMPNAPIREQAPQGRMVRGSF